MFFKSIVRIAFASVVTTAVTKGVQAGVRKLRNWTGSVTQLRYSSGQLEVSGLGLSPSQLERIRDVIDFSGCSSCDIRILENGRVVTSGLAAGDQQRIRNILCSR